MSYTRKLTLAMAVPTLMVAGAGGSVALGGAWLADLARNDASAPIADHLVLGTWLVCLLTLLCLASAVGVTLWIRRVAGIELGGDPALARQVLADMAEGRLDVKLPPAPQGSVLHSIDRLASTLRTAIGDIRDAAADMALVSQEIATGNQNLSRRTELSASKLRQTVSEMNDLAVSAQGSAESARRAQQLACSAASVAQRGGEVVGQVVSTMNEIHASARQIADIIGVIDSIAFQTNILALNAAVEAARAGEQGRGFAVVATEVRTLAGRSAEAARQIKALIGGSVGQVDAGSKRVAKAGQTMGEIVVAVQQFTDLIGEITQAAAEQSSGMGTIGTTVAQLDRMTQQNATLVEQSAAAAQAMRQQTQRLSQVIGMFSQPANDQQAPLAA